MLGQGVWGREGHGWADVVRAGGGVGDAGDVCAGGAWARMGAGVRRGVRGRVNVRVPAGRLALRRGGGDLGARTAHKLEAAGLPAPVDELSPETV